MYKYILFKPLGMRLKWEVSNICLGEILVEYVLDRYYLKGEQTVRK